MSFGREYLGGICLNGMVTGTRSTNGTVDGASRAFSTPCWKRWSNWDRRTTGRTKWLIVHRFGATVRPPAQGGTQKEGFGRSRGGFTSKIHARCDRVGRMIAFCITGGEASDSKQLIPLMNDPVDVPTAKNALGDAGYDSDANRDELLFHGVRPVIKPNPTRNNAPPFDKICYKARNEIERMFNRIKQMRRLATRYDKTLSSFRGFICLAAIKLWLPAFVNRS